MNLPNYRAPLNCVKTHLNTSGTIKTLLLGYDCKVGPIGVATNGCEQGW